MHEFWFELLRSQTVSIYTNLKIEGYVCSEKSILTTLTYMHIYIYYIYIIYTYTHTYLHKYIYVKGCSHDFLAGTIK